MRWTTPRSIRTSRFGCRATRCTSFGSPASSRWTSSTGRSTARPVSDEETIVQTALAAKSPYELCVDLGRNVPDSDVRSALASGEMGFLHSFTTGSAVDGPGVRVVAWTTGCMWRCVYCHNPDTWTMTNGIPVPVAKAIEELRKYQHGLKVMGGGFTLSGGDP